MITYPFDDYFSSFASIPEYLRLKLPLQKCNSIDDFWNGMSKLDFPFQLSLASEIDTLKQDIIMSVYTTVRYETTPERTFTDIFNEYASLDKVYSSNEDSKENGQKAIGKINSQLKNALCSLSGQLAHSNQYTDNNALLYFYARDNDSKQFKVFNAYDYIEYINFYEKWLYSYKHLDGEPIYDYLSSLQTAYKNILNAPMPNSKGNPNESKFNKTFSAYIMEELFHPSAYIRSVQKHLQIFEDDFTDDTIRKRSLLFLQPIAQMPEALWEKVADQYYETLHHYLHQPESLNGFLKFHSVLSEMLFLQNILVPFLQACFSHYLWTTCENDIFEIETTLKHYINENIDLFSYNQQLEEWFQEAVKITYPKTNRNTKSEKRITLLSPTRKKRNNNSVLQYECDSSKYLIIKSHYPHYYQAKRQNMAVGSYLQPQQYLLNATDYYLNIAQSIE